MNRRSFLKLVGATMAVLGASLQPRRAEAAVQRQEYDLQGIEAMLDEYDRAIVAAEMAVNADGERLLRNIHRVSDEMDTLLDTANSLRINRLGVGGDDASVVWTVTGQPGATIVLHDCVSEVDDFVAGWQALTSSAGGASMTLKCGFKE